jgi:hypothetical protein
MRHRYVVLALTAVCVAAVLLFWQRKIRYMRAALLVLTSFVTFSAAPGQSVRDFVIVSPERTIQLVQVENLPPNNLLFTFSNASSKPILEVCISAQRGPNEMVCKLGAANGAKLPGPGETFSMSFDAGGFASDGQQNTLRVDAVVYTDGSHVGEKRTLANIASRMVGVALETKRISDLLSNSPDLSAAGLDSVVPQIGPSSPSSPVEAAEKLRGESLPGVSPLVVNGYLSSPNQAFLEGVALERSAVLGEINEKKALAASPLTGSKNKQQVVLGARSHGLSDLAQKYQALNHSQVSYLISFMRAGNVE